MIGKPPGRFTLGDPDRAGYRDWCCSVDGRRVVHRPIDAGPGTALAQPDPNELACVACGQRIRHVPEIAAPPQFVCAGFGAPASGDNEAPGSAFSLADEGEGAGEDIAQPIQRGR